VLRSAIVGGGATLEVSPLEAGAIHEITWSGSRSHLGNVARQLQRVDTGEVVYLIVRADGLPVAKGGIDFAKEAGAGTIWQLATHPGLEGIGLATRLIAELEQRALERGVRRLRLAVELDDVRARRLYEHLGYRSIGESDASWSRQRRRWWEPVDRSPTRSMAFFWAWEREGGLVGRPGHEPPRPHEPHTTP
jgi:ribosomal protein S18 acetylase RimI-like enzyme